MGKRKAKTRKPAGPKKREPLSTAFTCLFCNHEKSIAIKMDKKSGVGDLSCKTCGQRFQTTINYLSAPVDVYSDWIDACEAVAKDAVAQEEGVTAADKEFSRYAVDERPPRATMAAPGTGYDEDDDGGYDDE